MTVIYYVEVNVICMIILFLFGHQMSYKSDQLSSGNRTFRLLLWTVMLLCASDMAAGIFRGKLFSGARALIEFSNLLYFETVSATSFLWMVYVLTKLKMMKGSEKRLVLWGIPFYAVFLVTLINPVTNWMFTVDENNLYTRNVGVYFHWLVCWFYLIAATCLIAHRIMKEQNRESRKKLKPFLYFIIAPTVAAVLQMVFYGVTCYQVGITLSVVVICLTEQNAQMLTDALTGLSNRHGFNRYAESFLLHHPEERLFLMMLDINNFKQVNDKFGHLEGDRALADVADAVKLSCEEAAAKLFVCRFGGDEFLVAGCHCQPEEILGLKERICEKLEEKNRLEQYPYVLSVSMGTAEGICTDSEDIDHLLRMADEAMYDEKKKSKRESLK